MICGGNASGLRIGNEELASRAKLHNEGGIFRTRQGRRDEAAPGPQGSPLSVLGMASPRDIVEFLQGEHPQTVAVVLSQLAADKAAAVLAELPRDEQVDVSRRIASLEKVDLVTLSEVQEALVGRLNEFAARAQSAMYS